MNFLAVGRTLNHHLHLSPTLPMPKKADKTLDCSGSIGHKIASHCPKMISLMSKDGLWAKHLGKTDEKKDEEKTRKRRGNDDAKRKKDVERERE